MAYLKGELKGKTGEVSNDGQRAVRRFVVVSTDRTEGFIDIVAVVLAVAAHGSAHPNASGIFASKYSATQDDSAWFKWTVVVDYEPPEFSQDDPATNPDDNPLLRQPAISYDTESIFIASRGEVNSSGEIIKGMVNSAGEAYDPVPTEDEVDLLLINITRWRTPFFSLSAYFDLQNGVNQNAFTFGDLSIPARHCKVRLRMSETRIHTSPNSSQVEYRQEDLLLVVHPLSWDLTALDFGTFYKDGGATKRFIEDGSDAKEFGLLDGNGGKKADNATEVYNFWKSRKQIPFTFLNLPAGP